MTWKNRSLRGHENWNKLPGKVKEFFFIKEEYYLKKIKRQQQIFWKSKNWKERRDKQLLKRPICEMCKKNKSITVHHFVSFWTYYKELIIDIFTDYSKTCIGREELNKPRRAFTNENKTFLIFFALNNYEKLPLNFTLSICKECHHEIHIKHKK